MMVAKSSWNPLFMRAVMPSPFDACSLDALPVVDEAENGI